MSYRIVLLDAARKDLHGLDAKLLKRLKAAILKLGENPRGPGCKRLQGTLAQRYRIRVGDYRILYEIRDAEIVVIVVRIAHRREAYN